VTTNGVKHLYEALLISATAATTLVAALTAWAAQLGGGAWLPVLVPFALVLVAPLATLAWRRTDQGIEQPFQEPGRPAQEPTFHLDREKAPHTARRVA
jgi:hypothetical protein